MSEPQEIPEIVPEVAEAEAAPEAMARALQALLDAKESELAAMKDQALRALAEAENTRRRGERELADMSKYAVTGFARDLVGVIENLQRAVDSIPPELKTEQPAVANLAVGVEMILSELLGIFNRQGIKRIDPMGQKFDHNLHEALFEAPGTGQPGGTVIQVIETGYTINDRLLRPARVGVAAAEATHTKVDTSI